MKYYYEHIYSPALFAILRPMIPVKNRFHGHNSLRYVYSNGKAIRTSSVTLKAVRNERRKNPRLSVVVSKKVLKSAVGRNRIRRRVYEYMRNRLPHLNDTYDIVLIVTSPELRLQSIEELRATIDQLLEKADLLKTS
jgi:ribonuclease P protein component